MKKAMLFLVMVGVGFMLVLVFAVDRKWVIVKGVGDRAQNSIGVVISGSGPAIDLSGTTGTGPALDLTIDADTEYHLMEFTTSRGNVTIDINEDGVLQFNHPDCNDIEAAQIVLEAITGVSDTMTQVSENMNKLANLTDEYSYITGVTEKEGK